MKNIIEVHWNFTDKEFNLVKIGTEIKNGCYRAYVIPDEAHFIDPKKSRLVRLAYKIHLFFQPKNKRLFQQFTNPFIGEPFNEKK